MARYRRKLGLVLAGIPLAALAGRPLTTDDATLTTAHSCQLETWYQHDVGGHQWWALPA